MGMKKLCAVLFTRICLLVVILGTIVTVGIFAWLIGTTINSVGSLKIDVLKKVSERSHIVCKAAISLAEAVDDTIDLFLKQDATLEHDDDLYCDIDEEFKYADIYYDIPQNPPLSMRRLFLQEKYFL